MKRSRFEKIIDENELSSGEEMAEKMELAGMQFDPEEPSAVEAFERADRLRTAAMHDLNPYEQKAYAAIQYLQAELAREQNENHKMTCELSREREAREKAEGELENIMDYGGFDLLKAANDTLKKRIEELENPRRKLSVVCKNCGRIFGDHGAQGKNENHCPGEYSFREDSVFSELVEQAPVERDTNGMYPPVAPESPELAKGREVYKNYVGKIPMVIEDYIAALEAEIARIKKGGGYEIM